MNPLRWKLHWQILAALVISFTIGLLSPDPSQTDSALAAGVLETCRFLGSLFMNALKMIVVPLIVASIISGVAAMGNDRAFGRMGIKVLSYYTLSGLLAILLGLVLVNLIRPGIVDEATAQAIVGQANNEADFQQRFSGRGAEEMFAIFERMFPPNIVAAATDNGQLLGLIVFSLLFGFFVTRLPDNLRQHQVTFWDGIQGVMILITDLIIRFAPIGVFGLVTPVIARTGTDALMPLLQFFITVALALGLHAFGTLSLALYALGRISPWQHIRAMAPVLLTAFSTASSSSTLPLTMETTEKAAGVSNRTASFTLPLGATVNMDGTALYECVVVIFIAQFYSVLQGFEIGLATQFYVVVLALLTSVGVAGIPAASLVAITVILAAVGLPIEAVGLVWATDRILDMARTAVNVYSDTCGAVIIAKSEGEAVYDQPVKA